MDRASPYGLRKVQGKHLFRVLGQSLVHNYMTAMLLKLSKLIPSLTLINLGLAKIGNNSLHTFTCT